jgi:carboxypeptidase C (cathepsin A)
MKFPELIDQDLYLTGDSYAGITIPLLAKLMVEKYKDRTNPILSRIRLRGFLLENPCTMGDECEKDSMYSHYTMEYLKNHYFISKEKYKSYFDKCTE